MTGVFHQEMYNFIVKPQYRILKELWAEHNIEVPEPVIASNNVDDYCESDTSPSALNENELVYDKVMIYYGTETGTSLRYATSLAVDISKVYINYGQYTGPYPMNDLPVLLQGEEYKEEINENALEDPGKSQQRRRTLILVFTSTFGKGYPPSTAAAFMSRMKKIPHKVSGVDFGVFALGNSAYTDTFAAFGHEAHDALSNIGCRSVMKILVADELKNQDVSSRNHMNYPVQ